MLRGLLTIWIAFWALFAAAPKIAFAQGAGGLDGPLAAANMCGAGEGAQFTIAATGDTFPHENIQAVGEAQSYDVLFDHIRPFLQAADLGYTNFDGAMLAGAGLSGYPNFNYSPALATALKNAGVGLVSMANNHVLDRGPAGLDATLGVLDAAGIMQHGAVRSDAAERPAYLPITLSRGGASIKVGFISATWGTNGIADPSGQVNLLFTSDDIGQGGQVRPEILDAVAQAKRETDLVVAAHWGQEYEFAPRPGQVDAARLLAEAGADVILGAQPHTLQPVDILDVDGRKALVIYSLGNFLASQGSMQAQSFTATSVIFYVGLARDADGAARVTGYRYLPTIHVDGDTRPAPIAPGAQPEVIAHVRQMMRDPDGLRQLPAEPPASGDVVAVCPSVTFPEAPDAPIPGDFAQHYRSLGASALTVLGLPLGPVRDELAGDCATPTKVLYTERQRLELHPESDWPFRVAGTQVGAQVFARRYPAAPLSRRTDMSEADAFADPRFKAFYAANGGLPVFGYPISGPIEEAGDDGAPRTVQYFERARFELAPGVSGQVQLGLLGREYPGIAAVCGMPGAADAAPTSGVSDQEAFQQASIPRAPAGDLPLGLLAQFTGGLGGWLPYLAILGLLLVMGVLVAFAVADWRTYRRRGPARGYRYRRSAHERFAAGVEHQRRRAAPPAPTPPAAAEGGDDDLLRELLGQ